MILVCPECGTTFERKGPQRRCSGRCKKRAARAAYFAKHHVAYDWRKNHPVASIQEYVTARRILTRELRHAVKLSGGVNRKEYPGGFYWVSEIKIGNEKRSRAFPVKQLGESGAKLAATFQRLLWLIEMGAWRPDDGDPLALLSYTDMLKGNRDYENSEVVDVDSPVLARRERDD